MAGVDGNGLTIKRLPDILSELQAAIKAQYGNDTPVDENSFFGILNTIYGASDSEVWELLQTLNNQFNPTTATDKWLDDVAAYLKITRLQPTTSKGELSLFGSNGAVVPIGTQFSDLNGAVYKSTTEGLLDTVTSRIPVSIVVQGGSGTTDEASTTFQITIDGDLYSYQTSWPPNTQEVTQKLQELVPSGLDYYIETLYDNNPDFYSNPIDYYEPIIDANLTAATNINVINTNAIFPIVVSTNVVASPNPDNESGNTPYMGVNTKQLTYTDTVEVESVDTGAIDTSINTLINIETPVVGLDTVYNVSSMTIGRDLETNEELRARIKQDGSINSYGTKPAIEANLRQVDGVSFVEVQVNNSYVEDSEGRPPNSYECVVIGGDEDDIATTIYNIGAAGIKPYGNTSVVIDDDQGNPQTIQFSRAGEIYVWVKVYYTKNPEEVFPSNGESLIESATLAYGEDLTIGSDVIPKRFFGSIYNSTNGIEDVTVKLATSIDPIVEPLIGEFTTDIIDIASNEVSSFADYRIEVIEE